MVTVMSGCEEHHLLWRHRQPIDLNGHYVMLHYPLWWRCREIEELLLITSELMAQGHFVISLRDPSNK